MFYGQLKKLDIADGEGVRVSLFVSGCRVHCKGCFNQDTWDFCFGKPFTAQTEEEILKAMGHDYISGLTVLGGEPFELENQRTLLPFIRRVKSAFPRKTIWFYSGYVYEADLLPPGGKRHCEATGELLSLIDVLVDGPFVQELRDVSLPFRGSRNQRILNLSELRAKNGGSA